MEIFDLIFQNSEINIPAIREKLIEADEAYYNDSVSIMSDSEYDNLKDQLRSMVPSDYYFSRIGAPVPENNHWKKVSHVYPMTSLNKVNSFDEFKKWFSDWAVVVMPKLDGISISLEYRDGICIDAVTRGDGKIGESILSNVKKMINFTPTLKNQFTGFIRGEIVLGANEFEKLNEKLRNCGKREFQNPRNAASGISKKLDGENCEFLTILCYDIYPKQFNTYLEDFDYIKILGIETCPRDVLINQSECFKYFQNWEISYRKEYDFDIDGLVFSINYHKTSESKDPVNGNPGHKIAWKFKSEEAISTVIDVTWEVGKNRRITPVIHIHPTKIGGVTVKKMTCHNRDMFEKMGVYIGGDLLFKRANDVIPNPIKMISNENVGIKAPKLCPVCGHETEKSEKYLICPNDSCPALTEGNLYKWIDALGILHISMETISKLHENGLLKFPSDFYKLNISDFESIEGLGEKSGQKIISQLNEKKKIPLNMFIAGLNINGFSSSMADKLIGSGYDNLDKIQNITIQELSSIPGIKEKISEKIKFGIEQKRTVISKLLDVGVSISMNEKIKTESESLSGKSFCFTGAINRKRQDGSKYTREEMQGLVLKNSGIVHDTVKKDTMFLVQADPSSQSSKSKKAIQYGTKVISEDEFFEMVGL